MLYVLTHDRDTEGVDLGEAQTITDPLAVPSQRLAESLAEQLDEYDWEQFSDWHVDFFDDAGNWLAGFELQSEVRREIDAYSAPAPPSIAGTELYPDRDEEPAPDRLTLPLFGDDAC